MDPTNVQVGVPSAVGVGSARALAKLYDFLANDGVVGGQRMLSPSTVKLLHEPLTKNMETFLFAPLFSRGLFLKNSNQVCTCCNFVVLTELGIPIHIPYSFLRSCLPNVNKRPGTSKSFAIPI